MKRAQQLLEAYIAGAAAESAALFAENCALELPYLADLGVEPIMATASEYLHERLAGE